jgi:hypothetical protein
MLLTIFGQFWQLQVGLINLNNYKLYVTNYSRFKEWRYYS